MIELTSIPFMIVAMLRSLDFEGLVNAVAELLFFNNMNLVEDLVQMHTAMTCNADKQHTKEEETETAVSKPKGRAAKKSKAKKTTGKRKNAIQSDLVSVSPLLSSQLASAVVDVSQNSLSDSQPRKRPVRAAARRSKANLASNDDDDEWNVIVTEDAATDVTAASIARQLSVESTVIDALQPIQPSESQVLDDWMEVEQLERFSVVPSHGDKSTFVSSITDIYHENLKYIVDSLHRHKDWDVIINYSRDSRAVHQLVGVLHLAATKRFCYLEHLHSDAIHAFDAVYVARRDVPELALSVSRLKKHFEYLWQHFFAFSLDHLGRGKRRSSNAVN